MKWKNLYQHRLQNARIRLFYNQPKAKRLWNAFKKVRKYRKFIRKNELHKEFKKLENSKLHQFPELYKEYLENSDVSDIKCVLQGHSINSAEGKLTNFGNRYFLDTGAFLTESFLNYNEDQKYEPFEDNQYKLTLLNIKDIK